MPFTKTGLRVFLLLLPLLVIMDSRLAAAHPVALASAPAAASSLNFEARLAHQEAIEAVYWRHRIWPQENPLSKPTLEAVLPAAKLRAGVEDSLRLSTALQSLWGQAITGEQLQAEMERQAQNSQQPEILRQLWAALGNDPAVIAETLARPALVERLARSWQAQDARFAGQSFDDWWSEMRPQMAAAPVVNLAYPYRLPPLAASAQAGGSWTPTFALPEGDIEATAIWTGAEMIVWGGTTEGGGGRYNSGSRYDPATDTWRPTSAVNAPEPRKQHTAIWTGTEMIVWGGCDNFDYDGTCGLASGGRYDPLTNSWRPISDAPGERVNHTAIWTGSEMIVWGGCAYLRYPPRCLPEVVGNDGLRYDPASDSWQITSTANAPSARQLHTAVWTGSEMIVWGGHDGPDVFNSGGRYNPATDSWLATTTNRAPSPRLDHTAVWSGARMIVWGGCTTPTVCGAALNTGRLYNPATDSWQLVRRNGAPSPRGDHTAVWAGAEMIVWGGCSSSCASYLATGGRYNPATNRWRPTSQVNAPEARRGHLAVWSGSLMIIWGEDRNAQYGSPRTGGRYDPTSDNWTATNANEAPSARYAHVTVWTGAEMIVWGGEDRIFGTINSGGRYNPATDSWQPTASAGAPSARSGHTAVWTGQEIIVWGGSAGSITSTGGRYSPTTNTWVATTTAGAPLARTFHSAIWTGTEMIVWGGSGNSLWMNSGGRYTPANNAWTATTLAGAPVGRASHTAIWTGQEMIVWGGDTATSAHTQTGGRYNPATDSWTPTETAGAPEGRTGHAAVWTGSRMLIWGGTQYVGGLNFIFFNDGALYDPASDTWTPMTLLSAPSKRTAFAYVWTGSELIVWGGCPADESAPDCGGDEGVHTGGQYTPVSDTWIPTTIIGAPGRYYAHQAVWSGNEMIVWGGIQTDNGTSSNHGGRYIPLQGEDTTPPLISEVTATSIGPDSAIIVWTTDEGATSQVEYGPTTAYGSITPLDPNLVLDHSVPLADLTGTTLYHYRVTSRDHAGNESVSGDYTFSTPDTVQIFRADYCYISGTLTVGATSTDATATLMVYNGGSGQFIGTLTNMGGGAYAGKFDQPTSISLVDVVSSSGGMATRVATSGSC